MKVSVLMPAFNAAEYIREAVESILAQDFRDFEFVVVDDGSLDGTAGIVESIRDPRIKLVRCETNGGIVAALNEGIGACSGEYVARMDADDVARKGRLSRQVEFMDRHPDCGCSGTWYRVMGKGETVKYPERDEDIRVALFRSSAIAHPTAILRREVFDAFKYEESYRHAEDYKLWIDIASKWKLANLQEVLLDYRPHSAQVSRLHGEAQRAIAGRIRLEQLGRLGIHADAALAEKHSQFLGGTRGFGYRETIEWAVSLIEVNRRSGYLPEPEFSAFVVERVAAISGLERYQGLSEVAARRLKRALAKVLGRA